MKQKGYTLIELLVALPIGAAVLAVVVTSIFQIMQGRVDIAQKTTAMADIDNAIHWLTRDLVLAQETTLAEEASPVSYMTMYWSDLTHWAAEEGTTDHFASYTLSGNQLLRNFDGQVTIIGRYMTDVDFIIEGKMFTITLTSCPGLPGSTVTRSISIQMRSDLEQ